MGEKRSIGIEVVTAKCVLCGKKRDIHKGEVPYGEAPMCPECDLPMVLDSLEEVGKKAKSSPARLEAQKRYARSKKGLRTRQRHRRTEKYKLTQKSFQQRKRGYNQEA